MALKHGNPAHLLPPTFKHQVFLWLEEDCPAFDVGGFVVGDKASEARLFGKSAVRWGLFKTLLSYSMFLSLAFPLTLGLFRAYWLAYLSLTRSFDS